MDFSLTPHQIELRERAAAWTSAMYGYELACETNGGLSDQEHREVRKLVLDHGLGAMNMPAEWGGMGLNTLEHTIVQEQVGRLTGALWDTLWRPANALTVCTPAQREEYLLPEIRGERRDAVAVTEPTAGSDPKGILTTATPTAGGYVLNGAKTFVTVGDVADFLLVLAQVDGQPTVFLVDTDLPGVSITRVPKYSHTFVYEHPEFRFENVRLGPEKVLGKVGQGYDLTRDWFVEERLMIAARTTGAAERATMLATEWAASRVQFGEPIISFQLIQDMLARNVVDIMANRSLMYEVSWLADQGMERKLLNAKAAAVKLSASEASNRCVDNAVQVFGGRGYMREYPVERLWRELRVDRIWEGTSEIQKTIIGNHLIKRGAASLIGTVPDSQQAPDGRTR